MRDYAKEFENRVAFIRDLLKSSGAKGVIYGNSGGKDSALVGILCKAACDNTANTIAAVSTVSFFTNSMILFFIFIVLSLRHPPRRISQKIFTGI